MLRHSANSVVGLEHYVGLRQLGCAQDMMSSEDVPIRRGLPAQTEVIGIDNGEPLVGRG